MADVGYGVFTKSEDQMLYMFSYCAQQLKESDRAVNGLAKAFVAYLQSDAHDFSKNGVNFREWNSTGTGVLLGLLNGQTRVCHHCKRLAWMGETH